MKSLARRPERVALGSVFIGVALVLGKLVVGLLTGSLGILSEAVHSTFDLAASTFTLFAVRTARKPADSEHPYGHGRAENLAAFAEGILLLITAIGIAFEAIRRLTAGGHQVNPAGYAFALLLATLLIEAGRAFILRRVGPPCFERSDAGGRHRPPGRRVRHGRGAGRPRWACGWA